ncbi:MAG TPA: hypothetical protein VE011_09765 [Candidatus Dormibacteraeota bacterium]|nr:hypothetical protein [Candidatus Dormibacteraeota bacterium]
MSTERTPRRTSAACAWAAGVRSSPPGREPTSGRAVDPERQRRRLERQIEWAARAAADAAARLTALEAQLAMLELQP